MKRLIASGLSLVACLIPVAGASVGPPIEPGQAPATAQAPSASTSSPSSPSSTRAIRTFHVGNSLTDTLDGWLGPMAKSAGRPVDFHRFTIPGAPTDWLWGHPGEGFGDSRYPRAFEDLAPIDALITQPFFGHDRSVDNEAKFSGKFLALCRRRSPEVRPWLYAQWPTRKFDDAWSKGEGSAKGLGLKPATTWQEGVANQQAYVEAVRDRLDRDQPGRAVGVVPAGLALAKLKSMVDAGEVPGLADFFAETFEDEVHLKPKGRYLVALVHLACLAGPESVESVGPMSTGLTDAQVRAFRRAAVEAVEGCRWARPSP